MLDLSSRGSWSVGIVNCFGFCCYARRLVVTTFAYSIDDNCHVLLQKLINSYGPVEDPSPVACASRALILGETEGLLSYKATSILIASSNCHFSKWDIDSLLLELLKVYKCTSSFIIFNGIFYLHTYVCKNIVHI